jgi:transcription elongation factor GreA
VHQQTLPTVWWWLRDSSTDIGRVVDDPLAIRHLATIAGVADIHQLSQPAYDRLAAEHEQLITHGRTDIARKIQAARELGDLKENGDYHAAKEEQGKMEGRINHLAALLLDCEIVEAVASDKVQMGSIVTIRFEDDDEPETYLIGSIEERRGDLKVVSKGSPLGSALMGHARSEFVDFEAPGGVLKVEILDIGA